MADTTTHSLSHTNERSADVIDAICGEMRTNPALPENSAAERIDIAENGNVVGLLNRYAIFNAETRGYGEAETRRKGDTETEREDKTPS